MENDDEYGEDRYIYKIDDSRALYNSLINNNSGFIGSIINSSLSYNRVSDKDYFSDFGNSLSTVSESSVKREIKLFGETYTEKIFKYEYLCLINHRNWLGVRNCSFL